MRCIAYLTWRSRNPRYTDELVERDGKNHPVNEPAQKRLAVVMTTARSTVSGIESAERATQILFRGELGRHARLAASQIFADVPSCDVTADQIPGEGCGCRGVCSLGGVVAPAAGARAASKKTAFT